MGKFMDFLKVLSESKIEIGSDKPATINNYYVYEDNRVIKLTESEFRKKVQNVKMINGKGSYIEEKRRTD